MNYTALDSRDLRKHAKALLGGVLKVDEMTDSEIVEELQAYDRADKRFQGKNKMETIKVFYLYKDGERVYRGKTYNDCLVWLHRIQGQSWDYAFKHGYSIKEEEEQGVAHDFGKET